MTGPQATNRNSQESLMTEQAGQYPRGRERLRRSLDIIGRRPRQLLAAGVILPIVTYRLHRHGYESTRAWLDRRSSRQPSAGTSQTGTSQTGTSRARTSQAGTSRTSTSQADPDRRIETALDLAFIVRLVARLVPDATCLRKALVLRHMLATDGIPSTIRLGARPQDDEQRYGFHAWVEVDGVVVSEAAEAVEPYSVLLDEAPGDAGS